MREVLIELRNISKSYGPVQVLQRIDLEVREGEVVAVLGPNGSGKTTLLKIMALLERPDEGEIFFKGRKIDEEARSSLRGRITMVFQENVWISGTVRENLSLGLVFRGMRKKEREHRIREVARRLKLEELLEKKMWQLSGGEQKRVCIGRALAIEPELLLLDEPTAWLDRENSVLIEKMIREIGTTVVFSTTDYLQARRLADEVFELRTV